MIARFGLRNGTLPRWCLPVLFVLLVLPVGLWFALRVPIGQVPDEIAHIYRAASLLDLQWIGHRVQVVQPPGNRVTIEGGVEGDMALLNIDAFPPWKPDRANKVMTPQIRQDLAQVDWSGKRSFIAVPNTASYMPLFYIPAALAFGAVHALGGTPYTAVLTGRVANAVVYALIGCTALWLAETGGMLLFALLCLPMSVFLAASFNQDGLMIATVVLAVALLRRAGDRKPGESVYDAPSARRPAGSGSMGQRAYWAGGILLAAVIAAKPPYLPLALVMLIPLRLNDVSLRTRIGGFLLVVAPAIVWSALVLKFSSVPFWRPDYHPGPLWFGDPGVTFHATDMAAQLSVLWHAPYRFVTLPAELLFTSFRRLLSELIGVFGTLDVVLPRRLYSVWCLALLAAVGADVLTQPTRPLQRQPIDRLLVLVAIAGSVWLVCLVQYLTWTQVGASAIDGVQGRYLIPALAVLPLALPAWRLSVPAALRTFCILLPVAVVALDTIILPLVIERRYYPG